MTSRAWRRASAPCSRPQNRKPKCTIGPASCSANSNSVTIAKFPPPPRSAQKRSGFSLSDAVSRSPCAVTTRAETRLSIASPYFRLSHPIPPPRVRPPTPVWLIRPTGTASPCAWVAASRSPSRAPPPTFARRASGSTVTCVHPAEVDHEAVVDDAGAGHAVPTAPDGDLETVRGGEPQGRLHVRLVGAPGDRERAAVDVGVPHPSCLVVRRVVRLDDVAAQGAAEVGDRGVRRSGSWACLSSCVHGGRCTVAPRHPPAQPSKDPGFPWGRSVEYPDQRRWSRRRPGARHEKGVVGRGGRPGARHETPVRGRRSGAGVS